MKAKIGILAYGSLVSEPGQEIEAAIEKRISGVMTDFSVEFARKSQSRGNAPTLVPVSWGSPVIGTVLMLRSSVSEPEAEDMLWRRETRKFGSYPRGATSGSNSVLIKRSSASNLVNTLLYTTIAAHFNAPPSPDELARLAISSVRTHGRKGLDGIQYLIDAISHGIRTPLTPEYEKAILKEAGALSLKEARDKLLRGTGL